MNSKKLIIAFFAVSLAALTVSCAAVISVARTYNRILTQDTRSQATENDPQTVEESFPSEEESIPESLTTEETEDEEEDITVFLPETVETEEDTETEISPPSFFTLLFESDRLVILSPDGENVYERITDASRIHPKDREALIEGIRFDTVDDAMNAIYDIVS